MSSKRFEDKVAIVTGGCRGIGKAIVERLAKDGCRVYALDYVLPQNPEEMFAGEEFQTKVSCLQTDVSSEASVNAAVETVIKEAGQISFLVNNAGITRDNLVLRMLERDWDSVLNTNLKGAFLCSKAVAKQMMTQRYGRIINIGSIVGTTGNAGQANYSASKAGLIGLTKSFAKEFGSRNILVNCVAPGFVISDMTEVLTEEQKKAYTEKIPLKRGATPTDIASVVSFFASEDASYLTGQVIHVDGGLAL
jgi:3-oxoacyl-[acyl-carrier protein] reductase